ncbi:MAG: Nudix family hydrolase [Proteobacteria bacterium]|jgi:8-oxo-dGTP diphosphatase|nr:Nudix family hydrolase [Pseudomonadota bacterium]
MPTIEADLDPERARIEVAVGVVRRGDDEVLVGQRLVRDRYFQKWEFPGGKLESGESPELALNRELGEELGIHVEKTKPLIRLDHDYPDRKVRLHVLEVLSYAGEPHGREGQAIEWVSLTHASAREFLAATQPIFRALTLPHRILITDVKRFGVRHICDRVKVEVDRCATAIVQIREPWMSADERSLFASQLIGLTRESGIDIVLNEAIALEPMPGITGVHLSAKNALLAVKQGHIKPSDMLLGCSCHNATEVSVAQALGADYLTVGSVASTPSHPDGRTLGFAGFTELSLMASLPTYAVGGMTESQVDDIRQAGGQGVAMISAAWL